ncbi:hypothetical protein [Streptomyces chiangmaiensis]
MQTIAALSLIVGVVGLVSCMLSRAAGQRSSRAPRAATLTPAG